MLGTDKAARVQGTYAIVLLATAKRNGDKAYMARGGGTYHEDLCCACGNWKSRSVMQQCSKLQLGVENALSKFNVRTCSQHHS